MRETYQKVEMEVITFDEKDVIVTSGEDDCATDSSWEGEEG